MLVATESAEQNEEYHHKHQDAGVQVCPSDKKPLADTLDICSFIYCHKVFLI